MTSSEYESLKALLPSEIRKITFLIREYKNSASHFGGLETKRCLIGRIVQGVNLDLSTYKGSVLVSIPDHKFGDTSDHHFFYDEIDIVGKKENIKLNEISKIIYNLDSYSEFFNNNKL